MGDFLESFLESEKKCEGLRTLKCMERKNCLQHIKDLSKRTSFLRGSRQIVCKVTPYNSKEKITLGDYVNEVLEEKGEWREFFEQDRVVDELKSIEGTLNEEFGKGYGIFPSRHNIFRIFKLLSPSEVKVVILGQDPYVSVVSTMPDQTKRGCNYSKSNDFVFETSEEDTFPAACGLAFSSPLDNVRPSLRNIMEEVKRTEGAYSVKPSGDLMSWVSQGVFLLNVLLTCRTEEGEKGVKGRSKSHTMWKGFAIHVLNYLSEKNDNMVLMFWGNEAIEIGGAIIPKHPHLESSHPVSRGKNNTFIGNGHFRRCREILLKNTGFCIDWKLDNLIYDSMYCCSKKDFPKCKLY